ncbi:hypothetical protein [Thalassovita aquimarina]|uniref:hypothetical protein n=1 Tax=Thalassovita aquimarina TaxID=2785917 RepID=UPI00356B4199
MGDASSLTNDFIDGIKSASDLRQVAEIFAPEVLNSCMGGQLTTLGPTLMLLEAREIRGLDDCNKINGS